MGELISRITSIGAGGIKTNPPPSSAVVSQEVKDLSRPNAADELLKLFDNQAIQISENVIRDSLLTGLTTPIESERTLVRHLAGAWLTLAFDYTYNYIWGSQIEALEALNQSGTIGLSRDFLVAWYEYRKAMSPGRFANCPFDAWLGWMHGMYLVETGLDGLVRITVCGNESLQYLVRSKYNMHKEG